LIFPGGNERNDELRSWMDRRFGVHQLRGTGQGILTELKRICATEDVFLITDTVPTEWILDITFPDVTPIWLDLSGTLKKIYVEFAWICPNFTLGELACLIKRYRNACRICRNGCKNRYKLPRIWIHDCAIWFTIFCKTLRFGLDLLLSLFYLRSKMRV